MATRRSELIDNETPGFYHLISRCVRRAFLCGVDEETGISYEHRRKWIESRILELARIFSVSVYSYAVMHNHYHLVVYFDPKAPWQWSDNEVAERWVDLFPVKKTHSRIESMRQAKLLSVLNDKEKLEVCRQRLSSISWLMRCINEPIAKRSNAEDFAKGHFWESRFKSQVLLDESAALTCMAYVDLNPIRAGLTTKVEDSEYTSIQRRLLKLSEKQLNQAVKSIAGTIKDTSLSIKLNDYIELVDWTGEFIVHPDKASIPQHLSKTLQRLNLNQKQWLVQVKAFGSSYYRAIGALDAMKEKAKQLGQRWLKGVGVIKELYLTPE